MSGALVDAARALLGQAAAEACGFPALDPEHRPYRHESCLAKPGSVDELSALLRLAAEERARVSIVAGEVPSCDSRTFDFEHDLWHRPDLVVSLARFDRLLEHQHENLTASIECGARFDCVQRALALRGQRIPLDPLRSRSVGGVLATDDQGPLALRFGRARDWLIGAHLVRPDGDVARTGGRVVKNVSGYDLCKLYTGSFGTLGVLVNTEWKLEPLPAAWCCARVTLRETEARAWVRALGESRLPLVSASFDRTTNRASGEVVVAFEGRPETMRAVPSNAEACIPTSSAAVQWFEDFGSAAIEVRRGADLIVRAMLPPRVLASECFDLGQDVGLLLSGPARLRALLGTSVSWLHANLDPEIVAAPSGDPAAGRLVDALGALRGRAHELGGWIAIERAPASVFASLAAIDPPAEVRALMQSIQQTLDPSGVFPRGPFEVRS